MSDQGQVFWAVIKKPFGTYVDVRISPLFDAQLEAFKWADERGHDFSSQEYQLRPLLVNLKPGTVSLNFGSECVEQ